MFTNWFAEKAPQNLHSTSQNPVLLPTDAPSSTPGLSVEAIPVLTPHDAAVEEVVTKLQDLKESAASETSERSQDPPSISGLVPKNIYDPFEGQPIGLLHASQGGKLWDHLAQVRDLQSEIARMHARMEGLGAAEPMLDRQGSNDGESLTAEEQAKAAQSAEFARLSSRFEERKEAVEKIMMKLDDLSKTINEFHSNRAPLFRNKPLFPAERADEDRQAAVTLPHRLLSEVGEGDLKDSPESLGQSLFETEE